MATSDIYPSLESSNNVSSTDHQGRLFIALPSANSFDNRVSLTTNGNLTPSPNSADNNPRPTSSTTRITNNRSNICQIIFNRYSQRNSASAPAQAQRQQSHRQAQEVEEMPPPPGEASTNLRNDNTQEVPAPSPITTDSITTRNNVPESEASTNQNT